MKRKWTRGEKWLWATPLIFVIGAAVAVWGPDAARRQLGRPTVLNVVGKSGAVIRSIALSDDGTTIVASIAAAQNPKFDGGRISMWDANTLKVVQPWEQRANAEINRGLISSTDNYALALAPNAKNIAYARLEWAPNTGLVSYPFSLFDVATGRILWKASGFVDYASKAHFSPDGKIIGFTRLVQNSVEYVFLRVSDGKPVAHWMSYNVSDSADFAWAKDGKIVSVGTSFTSQKRVDFWKRKFTVETHDLRDGKLLSSWPTHSVLSFDLAADGRLALVTTDVNEHANFENIRLGVMDNATGRELWGKANSEIASKGAKFSPDGKTLAVIIPGLSSQMALLDSQSGALKRTLKFEGQNTMIHGPNIDWSPDGKRLFSFSREAVLVWDLN